MRPAVESAQLELPRAAGGRNALALAASVAAHLLFGAMVVATRRENADESRPGPARQPRVELAALPPYVEPPSVELPPTRVPRPQVRRDQPLPEEVTVRPAPPPPDLPLGEIPPATAPSAADLPPAVESPAPTPLSAAEVIQSEARRLFGPRNAGADRPLGPIAARSWATEVTEDRENDCTPRPPAPREPGMPPEMGEVAGIVYREGTRQPLAGAFLQIMGTRYSTFADDRGAYTLKFDKALIDACRTQYVQVSKDGFAPRRLILSLGRRLSNDIPLTRR